MEKKKDEVFNYLLQLDTDVAIGIVFNYLSEEAIDKLHYQFFDSWSEDKAVNVAYNFIEEHNLDFGNAETYTQFNSLFVYVEAPNHWTVLLDEIELSNVEHEEQLLTILEERFIEAVDRLDVDDYFNEVWSREFGLHNGFTPSSFLSGLQEDLSYFVEIRDNILYKRGI